MPDPNSEYPIEAKAQQTPLGTSYDLLVIGSGPAGQKAAIQAAKLRKRVGLIERDSAVGGVCVTTGTLPSKTLRDTVLTLRALKQRDLTVSPYQNLTMQDLLRRKDQVVQHEVNVIVNQLTRNRVRIIPGEASFLDPHRLQVLTHEGQPTTYEARFVVIATGSRPNRPASIPFDDIRICDSNSILNLAAVPQTLTIIGGGVIGCEYASIFAAMGTRVTLVDRRKEILRFMDSEIIQALIYEMRNMGISFRLSEDVERIAIENGTVAAHLVSKKRIQSERLLYCIGRIANTDRLNLERAQISASGHGHLQVNEFFQTSQPHIYAVGDVIGFPSLASTSFEQGRLAAGHAFDLKGESNSMKFPYGIFTIPEISTVGETEEDLTTRGIPYESGLAYYRELARGQIVGDTGGLLKILFHRETLEVLGVHVIGQDATELVHIGQAVLSLGGKITYFVNSTFNYPTLAEAYKVAALHGLNKLS